MRITVITVVLVSVLSAVARAADPAVMLFLRPGQSQSDDAVAQITAVMSKRQPPAQVSIIISGPSAASDVAKFAPPKELVAKVVGDSDYALAGKHSVHVWPATVLLGADGKEIARIAGLPQSYVSDLMAYFDLADGKIDRATLEQRLRDKHVVAPTSQQAATRHVIIANALIERGQLEAALKEVDEGLQRQPGDVSLRVARAKLLLELKQPAAALSAAEELADRVPPWQIHLIRAEALIAMERWDDAKIAAQEAVKLNPNPAHANYLRGLVLSHEADWKGAADAFRRAYESARTTKHS